METFMKQQIKLAKLQCILTAAMVFCCVLVLVVVLFAAVKITELSAPIKELTGQLQELATQAETVMENLNIVAEELAQSDLGSMAVNVNTLVTDGQAAIEEALTKIQSFDIEKLNKAISDLSAIVEPLAKIKNVFR